MVATRATNIEEEDLHVEPTEEEEEPALNEIEYVVQVLMKRGQEQSSLSLALKKGGIVDVTELLSAKGRFENISFIDKDGVVSRLEVADLSVLDVFCDFARELMLEAIGNVEWLEVTAKEFATYWSKYFCTKPSVYRQTGTPGIPAVNPPAIGGGTSSVARVSSSLQDFEKGIRRDATSQPTLS
jgi:hypothetical protein